MVSWGVIVVGVRVGSVVAESLLLLCLYCMYFLGIRENVVEIGAMSVEVAIRTGNECGMACVVLVRSSFPLSSFLYLSAHRLRPLCAVCLGAICGTR